MSVFYATVVRSMVLMLLCAWIRVCGATLLTTSLVENPQGALPYQSPLLEVNGNFYGETQNGGLYGDGTVFEITPNGTVTTLVNFNETNGKQPSGGLILASDGYLYGTTAYGGATYFGTVFKLSLSGSLTTLVSFGGAKGENPLAGVIQGVDGNFYGTTHSGSLFDNGEVFKMTPSGAVSVLSTFYGNTSSGLNQGADGNFYGVTDASLSNNGSVFKITTNGSFITLFTFTSQGSNPTGKLIQDNAGNFYGMTEYGGSSDLPNGGGTVFELMGSGNSYILNTLVSFNSSNGALPFGGLYRDGAGNLFGVTTSGGSSNNGTAFELSPVGSGYALVTLATFTATSGSVPMSSLIADSAGNLYGTTSAGGSGNAGTVFEISGTSLTTLAAFPSYGTTPYGGLVQGPDGNFYGTTHSGGPFSDGTVFEFIPGAIPQTLINFDDTNGANPQASLLLASDGNFYGTTSEGGSDEEGTVFKFSSASPGTSFSTLVDFNQTNGASPSAALIQASDGNLYGSTQYGGTQGGYGTIFQILLSSSPAPQLNTLYSFNGTDGWTPDAPLLQGTDGNLYGTTIAGGTGSPAPTGAGTVFELTLSGNLAILESFDESFGSEPEGQLTEDSAGNLYGTTRGFGTGTPNLGTVYKLTSGPSGEVYSTLVTLGNEGTLPEAGLFLNSDGNFYGTTSAGGAFGLGTIFECTPGGNLTTLIDFNGSNGTNPSCSLIKASDGNYYGTTQSGGTANTGTVFCLQPNGTTNFNVGSSSPSPITAFIYSIEGSALNLTLGYAPAPATSLTLIHDTQGPINGTFSNLPDGGKITAYYNGVAYTFTANYMGNGGDDLVLSLSSSALPSVSSENAADISASTATLSALVNPNGSGAVGSFQYGTTTAYGATTSNISAGSGTKATSVSTTITGILPETTYHYQAIAINEEGTVYGKDKTFTTLAAPQFGAVQAYTSASGAEVSAAVNPSGVLTSIYFQYGTSSSDFTNQTNSQSLGNGKKPKTIFALLPDLLPGTTYYFQEVTTGAAGTFYGSTGTFTTPSATTVSVVEQGATANGTSGGLFGKLGNPAINQSGYVAFNADLTGLPSSQNSGIWADDLTGNLQLIAQAGISAPGTNGVFDELSDPVYNENEGVAFWAKLKVASGQATSSTAAGIWSSSSGSVALVARQGSSAPGVNGGTFASFTSLGLTDSAGVVFLATLNTGSGINSTNDSGIWEGNTGSDLHLVLRLGTSVAGKTIAKLVFLPTETCVNGQTRSFTPTGDLTLAATFTDKTTGLIKVIEGVPQLTIVSGTIDGSTGATFASFGNPAINATDDTAFQAILSGTGVTSTNNSGIWGDNAQSVRQLIARTGDTAPGTTATFTGFSDPVFNTHKAVAFRGTLKVATGQATSSSNEGIWSSDTGQLSLVVQKAGSAPGCPTGASFSGFTELVLPDQGGVVFLAQLSTSTPAAVTDKNNVGIWAVDSNHELQLLVRTGDVIGGKTITKLAFLPALNYVSGQNRSFDQTDGEIAYLATFSDNTTEIFEINSR